MFSHLGIHSVDSITVEEIEPLSGGCNTRKFTIKADGGNTFEFVAFSYNRDALKLFYEGPKKAAPTMLEVVK
jgi:hypothetical protein